MRKYWVFSFCGWLEVCQAGHTSNLETLPGWHNATLEGVATARCKAEALHLALESRRVVEACYNLYHFLDESAPPWFNQGEECDLVIED